MTFGDAKNKALVLIDSYSNQGDIIQNTDSNQQDYLLKMPFLFDTVQRQIAQVKKIQATATIPAPDSIDTTVPMITLSIPDDFYDIQSLKSGYDNVDYLDMGNGNIAVESETVFPLTLLYYRFPTPITSDTLDTWPLENTVDAQECYPFFVASQLLQNEQGKRAVATTLFSIFQSMVANLTQKPKSRQSVIENSFFKFS